MSQSDHYRVTELWRRLGIDEVALQALTTRVATLEAILLNVPPDRLLGRYATTTGPAQFIRIGTGLDLVDDILTNTGGGGGGGGGITSFTLICFDDLTEHEITCVLDQGEYTLLVNQAPSGSGTVTGKTFTCSSDATDHVLRLRLDQGFYTLEVVQSPGGSGAVASIVMTCAADSTDHSLTIVLDQGYYTWDLT